MGSSLHAECLWVLWNPPNFTSIPMSNSYVKWLKISAITSSGATESQALLSSWLRLLWCVIIASFDMTRGEPWDYMYRSSADKLSGSFLTHHTFQCEWTFAVHSLGAGFSSSFFLVITRSGCFRCLTSQLFSCDTSILNARYPTRTTFKRQNFSFFQFLVFQIFDRFPLVAPNESAPRLDVVLRGLLSTGSKNKSGVVGCNSLLLFFEDHSFITHERLKMKKGNVSSLYPTRL